MSATALSLAAASLPGLLLLTDIFVDKSNPNCAAANGTQAAPFCTINQALAIAASGDTIRVAPGTYNENLFWANIDVSIIGTAGAAVTIVDGGANGSVAIVPPSTTAVIEGLTLRNGSATQGGGINSRGALTLRNSTVSGNVCTGGYYGAGGGIASTGSLTLVNTTVSNNSAQSYRGGGGIFATGGAVTLTESRILGNNASYGFGASGAGICAVFATSLTLTNCTVSGNSITQSGSGNYGAGVFTYKTPLFVNSSTISGNSTSYLGGGIFAYKSNPSVIRNTTISGNTGTGLLTYGGEPYPTTVLNCTIVNNNSNFRAGGFSHDLSTPAQVRNTIIAGNFGGASATPDLDGAFSTLGHNLIGDNTGGTGFINAVAGDQVGSSLGTINPQLQPLASNGGPTQTHALLPTSPAVDAGDPVVFEALDQRGVPRPAGASDIGAFELESTSVFCTAGTTTNGCLATMSGTGTPSATAASGFTIGVSNLEGQRQGLIFYGVDNSGFSPLPWGLSSSFLCVKPPTQRTPIQSSGGVNATCTGAYAIDWNAFRNANPGALGAPFASGDVVYAQAWFRDPPSPKATMLSNGLIFVVTP